jgi:hypothetical protein
VNEWNKKKRADVSTMGVLSFQEKELLRTFSQQDWKAREVREAYDCPHAVKRSCVREPSGSETEPLLPERVWEQRYPLRFAPFQAGKLFSKKFVW